MTKYPVKYLSGSKKAELNIEDMNTSHLMNSWRKLRGELEQRQLDVVPTEDDVAKIVSCMHREIESRGGTLDLDTLHWSFPPKGGAQP